MRTICILILVVNIPLTSSSQVYIDPAVAAATGIHAGIINGQLDDVNDKLTMIQRGQLSVAGQLTIVNDMQDKIYRGLSEVSAAVRSLLSIKEIASVSRDIVRDVGKATDLAAGNPVLLLFAEAGAREFKQRATNLAAEVNAFALRGGKDNLMDAGERAKILNKIYAELSIIRGVAYGMYRSMFWAKQRGILASLNPYASFVNIDKRIADDILRNSKLIKR